MKKLRSVDYLDSNAIFLKPFRPIFTPQTSFQSFKKIFKLFKMSSDASVLQEVYFSLGKRINKHIS